MTKVTVIGEVTKPTKIEFLYLINVEADGTPTIAQPSAPPGSFEYLELVCRGYNNGLDLMFAHDGDRTKGCAYLGHFNDGIV